VPPWTAGAFLSRGPDPLQWQSQREDGCREIPQQGPYYRQTEIETGKDRNGPIKADKAGTEKPGGSTQEDGVPVASGVQREDAPAAAHEGGRQLIRKLEGAVSAKEIAAAVRPPIGHKTCQE